MPGPARDKAPQPVQLGSAVHEHARLGWQLAGNDQRVAGMAFASVEVHAPGDIAGLDDVAAHLGAADLAPYFTRTGTGAL